MQSLQAVTSNVAAPQVVVISGPSGAGKTTIVRRLLAECPLPLRLSVSATTRTPRPGEQDGVDYHFLSNEQFKARLAAGEFLEYCEVFGRGPSYGTFKREVEKSLAAGRHVILEIDVDGARQVLQTYPKALTIFIRTETLENLEQRLRARGTESEEALARRLEVARREMEAADFYKHHVINRDLDEAVKTTCDLLKQEGE